MLADMANLTFFAGGRKRRLQRPRPFGNYVVRFQHKGKDIEYSTRTTNESAAKERARRKISEVVEGETLQRDASIDELIQRFTAARQAKGDGTTKNDKSFAANFRATFHLPLTTTARQIPPGDLLAWLNKEASSRKWKNRTYNHYRLWLRQIFDLAAADRLILANEHPFKEKKTIRRKRPEKVVRLIPTLEQFRRIIDWVALNESSETAEFLDFLGSAGVGQAEAKTLTPTDVGNSKLKFIRRKTGVPFEVPIFQWLAPLMIKLLNRTKGNGPIFHVGEAGKTLRRACNALSFPRFTQRGLRAMLIKRLYDAGVPVKRIAQWQGHQDGGKMIQEIYTEVFCDTDAAAENADLEKVGGGIDLTSVPQLTVVDSVA